MLNQRRSIPERPLPFKMNSLTHHQKPAVGRQTPRQMIKAGWSLAGKTTDETMLAEIKRDYLARQPEKQITFARDDDFNFYFGVK